jgi:multiple sugar transport system permease protein
VETVVPFYLLARWSGLFDSLVVLIIAHATFHLPLVVVLTYPRFRELPRSLEESAAIEGCSALRFFAAFALPAVGPTVGAAALVVLSFSWNEFLFSLLLTSRHVLPLTRLIQSAAENDWGIQLDAVAVIGLIAVAPPVVFGLVTFSVMARGLGLGRGG